MKLRNALLAASIIAAPVAAMAQPVTGPYVSLGAGYNWMQNNATSFVPTRGRPQLRDEGGPIGSLAGGFGFGNGLRVEIQGDYRFDAAHLNKGYRYGGGTDIQNFGVMANVLYDLPTFGLPIVPYVGGGGGYEFTDFQRSQLYTIGGAGAAFREKAIGSAAAQGIAGVAYQVPGAPGLAITGEYRFMTIFSAGMHDNGSGPVPNRFKIGNQYDHAILVGLRYNFGQAPAAPPPPPAAAVAPAVAPARTYLVFFDWDKSDLTPRARQIVAEAATASTRVAVTKIDVSGYTDSSGTPTYNQGLSMRRANTVSAELVRLGVPRGVISINAFGETHQLVPTANGVREPQNRRVEIVLH